ncbi:LysR substrate-binding domain-containing protein, partial [Kibdelosporangium lantanae]
ASFASGTMGRVELAAFASAITQVVAPAIRDLRAHYPDITVLVRDAEGHASLPLLLDGSIDIAITEEQRVDNQRLYRVPLYTEPFDVVLPETHPLAEQDTVSLADLVDDPWIAPLPGNPCRDAVVGRILPIHRPVPDGQEAA